MQGLRELVFRYRDKIAVAIFLAVLAYLVRRGKTLGLGEPAEDWLDAFGFMVIVVGHTVRILALRHIGPYGRTHQFKTPRLVKEGPYAIVRNPLYVGNWLIALGLCLIAQLRWLLLAGPLLALLLYYLVALAEEQHLLRQFGEPYEEYCRTTPRFFPSSLFSARGWRTFLHWGGQYAALLRTKEYQAFLSSGACVMLLELLEQLRRASGLQ